MIDKPSSDLGKITFCGLRAGDIPVDVTSLANTIDDLTGVFHDDNELAQNSVRFHYNGTSPELTKFVTAQLQMQSVAYLDGEFDRNKHGFRIEIIDPVDNLTILDATIASLNYEDDKLNIADVVFTKFQTVMCKN